jgi:hypothetical protein
MFESSGSWTISCGISPANGFWLRIRAPKGHNARYRGKSVNLFFERSDCNFARYHESIWRMQVEWSWRGLIFAQWQ